jgi:hypothetical protein
MDSSLTMIVSRITTFSLDISAFVDEEKKLNKTLTRAFKQTDYDA